MVFVISFVVDNDDDDGDSDDDENEERATDKQLRLMAGLMQRDHRLKLAPTDVSTVGAASAWIDNAKNLAQSTG